MLPLLSFLMIVFFTARNRKLSPRLFPSRRSSPPGFVYAVLSETDRRSYGDKYDVRTAIISWAAFPTLNLEIGILIDSLTAIMLVVVTTCRCCVQIYSLGYMHGDPRFSRFYAYLSLFTFSMLGLVLANNFFMIFIFWELVGLTSYLLIGFWFEKKSAADAGKKAFITTRIGDLGFIVGLMLDRRLCRDIQLSGSLRAGRGRRHSAGILTFAADRRLLRRGRQVGAVPAACLAARCDGRPHAGFGVDPCRHDGCRRCLSRRALDGLFAASRRCRNGGRDDRHDHFVPGGINRSGAK